MFLMASRDPRIVGTGPLILKQRTVQGPCTTIARRCNRSKRMRIRWWRLAGAGGWWWGRPVCPHASHESRDRRASAHTMTAARWYGGLTDPHCPAGSATDAAPKAAGTGGALGAIPISIGRGCSGGGGRGLWWSVAVGEGAARAAATVYHATTEAGRRVAHARGALSSLRALQLHARAPPRHSTTGLRCRRCNRGRC